MKKYLIINTHSPMHDWHTEENLELILSIASLEGLISILFLQSAAFQLLKHMQPKLINRDLLSKTMEAFELFALQNIYVEDTMLKQINTLNTKLLDHLNIIPFSLKDLDNLYNQHDLILFN